ncbi:Hypothetical protein precursor [Devosia sp. LC5]|uniref:PAN domain-containing protein n=1 Tax=Devosia sp. LC5 TaxID=1502724 RepID=UPI0004E41A4F|nr:PAN domain-containing protein [Devosia sp. LC5]KFC62797.1 Hypothetical protein precursor [Devosia sp. LC5]
MRILVAVLALVLSIGPAFAAGIARQGAFILPGAGFDFAILAGDITNQTPDDFRAVLASQPNIKTLVLSSDGGPMAGALLLADEVYRRGINTYIPPTSICQSSCAYVFFAGAARLDQGELGVHHFYGGDSNAASQLGVTDIMGILTGFGTPQAVINRMLRTPANAIYTFNPEEVTQLRIDRNPSQLDATLAQFRQLPQEALTAMGTSPGSQSETTSASSGNGTPPQSVPRFAIYEGLDFYGADIDKIRAETLEQCFQKCVDNQQCSAMTINLNPTIKTGPNCFLKSGMGRTEPYEHAISGAFLAAGFDGVLDVNGTKVAPTEIIPLE